MITSDHIKLYLDAVDKESNKERELLKVQVHAGYRNTIERYLNNSSGLSFPRLMSILSLYSLEDLDVRPVQYEGILISFIPQARVELDGVEGQILIDIIPQPRLTLEGQSTQVIAVPQPRITLQGLLAQITYIGQPRVTVTLPIIIDHVNQPRITFENQKPYVDFANVPQPRITFSIYEDPDIINIPHPRVIFDIFTGGGGDVVYWGVIQGYGDTERSNLLSAFDFTQVNNFSIGGLVENVISFQFDSIYGYMVFAIPSTAALRNSYRDPNGLVGAIGGAVGPWNLFPDPNYVMNNALPSPPREYMLYVANYRTQPINGVYDFRTQLA
jgi:hypothetical protein